MMGKSLLWFWQQALRCECPALQGSYHSSVTQWKWKANKAHTKIICLWIFHLLVLEEATDHHPPLPRTPHRQCAWLETICKTENHWYEGVKKVKYVKKSITQNANSTASSLGLFSVERAREAAIVTLLWPACHSVSLSHSSTSVPWLFSKGMWGKPYSSSSPNLWAAPQQWQGSPCRLWQHRKGEVMN